MSAEIPPAEEGPVAPEDRDRHDERLASFRGMIQSFGVLTLGETGARLLSFVAIIWMTRRLGVDRFGLVALGSNLVLWFGLIVNSSTQTIGLRDVARMPERFKAILEPLLGVRLAVSVVAMVLLAITSLVIGKSGSDHAVLLLFVLVLPFFSLNLRFSLLALNSAKAVALGNVLSQLIFAAGVLLLVSGPSDAFYVPMVQALGECAYAALLLGWVAPRVGLLRPRVDRRVWREHLKEVGPLMVSQAGRATLTWYDSFLIAVILGESQLGFYSAAYRPILFVSYAISLLWVSFFTTYNAARSEHDRVMLISRTLRFTVAFGFLIAIGMTAGSGLIVSILFGHAFANAATPLAILAWTLPLFAAGPVFGGVLVTHHQQRLMMRHSLTGVALNVLGNFAAVPLFGINGAAVLTVISWMLIIGLNYRSCVSLGYAPPLTALLTGRHLVPAGVAR